MSRVRTAGQWLVGGLFVLFALGALAAGEEVSGIPRGLLAAAILLAAAGLAIPRTRARINDASARTIPARLVAALLVVGLVAGIEAALAEEFPADPDALHGERDAEGQALGDPTVDVRAPPTPP